jgi:hypothetical protein
MLSACSTPPRSRGVTPQAPWVPGWQLLAGRTPLPLAQIRLQTRDAFPPSRTQAPPARRRRRPASAERLAELVREANARSVVRADLNLEGPRLFGDRNPKLRSGGVADGLPDESLDRTILQPLLWEFGHAPRAALRVPKRPTNHDTLADESGHRDVVAHDYAERLPISGARLTEDREYGLRRPLGYGTATRAVGARSTTRVSATTGICATTRIPATTGAARATRIPTTTRVPAATRIPTTTRIAGTTQTTATTA